MRAGADTLTSDEAPRRHFHKGPESDRLASAAAVRAVVIAFSTIEITACLGLLTLFLVCAFTERLRRNPVLLNFSLIFALTAGGTPMLT
jgi:hypothetical protein